MADVREVASVAKALQRDLDEIAGGDDSSLSLPRRIEQLEEQRAELRARRHDTDDEVEKNRLFGEEVKVSDEIEKLTRQEISERLGRYATRRPRLDRAKQLEATQGDVMAALVSAQLQAERGEWDGAVELLKGAKARLADAYNLAKAVSEVHLLHERGAQLALPEVE